MLPSDYLNIVGTQVNESSMGHKPKMADRKVSCCADLAHVEATIVGSRVWVAARRSREHSFTSQVGVQ